MNWDRFFRLIAGILMFLLFALIFEARFGIRATLGLVGMFLAVIVGLDIDFKGIWKKRDQE
jgi:hypothetical protein